VNDQQIVARSIFSRWLASHKEERPAAISAKAIGH
jgi:hypothetical protein